jgi:hypothetical protein
MIDDRRPAGWLERAGVRYENLLRNSPRRLEVTCALLLGTLALMLFYDLALHRWLYFMYHQYYRSTPASRVYDWTVAGCEILIGVWLAGLAIDLARGASRRGDRRLFSPAALRIWGVVFALAPFGLLAISRDVILHFHLLLWCWGAAIACFALAARRARPPETEVPPPIG